MTPVECDVLICGLGPVGQLLANLLGGYGVTTIAIDEAAGPHALPRAAVIDDEVLRIVQAAGLDEAVLQDAQVQDTVSFISRRGRRMVIFRPEHGDFGHPPMVSIHQPSMERTFLAGLERHACVDPRWGQRLQALDRSADHVTAWVSPSAGGPPDPVRARWLIACDGGRSPVRARLGLGFGGSTFAQRWLVVDALVDRPIAGSPHPHFVGDPRRPVVSVPMSVGRHRWEWMLHPGEDAAPFLEPARIRELIAPALAGAGVQIERAVVYTFHARTADRWRAGRVLLAGDAAHVMPPFVGQGFSSGVRDVGNLAWKLDAVLHGAPDHLLDSYETERRPHVRQTQRRAVQLGGVVQSTRPAVAWVRDRVLEALDVTGALERLQGRAKPPATYADGAFARRPHRFVQRRGVGSLFPQPLVRLGDGNEQPLDDVIGLRWAALSTDPGATCALRTAGLPVWTLPRDLTDHRATISSWLDRHDATWVVLRPDR
ncbi:MAG: Monooxygenase, partial [Frankiales bacterium]|nr:Monooxygenase [Frankiales bacterium]